MISLFLSFLLQSKDRGAPANLGSEWFQSPGSCACLKSPVRALGGCTIRAGRERLSPALQLLVAGSQYVIVGGEVSCCY